MPCYSYNNIIVIATNVIIFEFLSDQFVHSGAMQPFYLFQHELEHNIVFIRCILPGSIIRLLYDGTWCQLHRKES